MIHRSTYFSLLRRGIAIHRRALLKGNDAKLIFPPLGAPWMPDRRQQSKTDAFVFFCAAELETYFESVLSDLLDINERISLATPTKLLTSHQAMHKEIIEKKKELARNNNTSWLKISKFWNFLGIGKEKFPDNFWDHVDNITNYRGDVAHLGWGVRQFSDPRLLFREIENLLPLIERFDRDFFHHSKRYESILISLENSNIEFIAGMGTLNTSS